MHPSAACVFTRREVRLIAVNYEAHDGPKPQMAKTIDPEVAVGDHVVIETGTRHGMTVVLVSAVDVEPDLNTWEMVRWIVARLPGANDRIDKLREMDEGALDEAKKALAMAALARKRIAGDMDAELEI